MFTFLRRTRPLNQLRQRTLVVGAVVALLLAFGGETMVPTVQRAGAAPRLQESPLSPLTPANATMTDTEPITTTTVITVREPLSRTEVAPAEITPAEISSPLPTATVPVTPTLAPPVTETAIPVTESWSLSTLLASGQVSLVLVGALFVGLFTVIGLVLGRRP